MSQFPIKLIIFDLDNTLVDRNRAFGEFMEVLIARSYSGEPDSRQSQILQDLIKLDRGAQTGRREFCKEACQKYPGLYTYRGNSMENGTEDSAEIFFRDHDRIIEYIRPEYSIQRLLTSLKKQYQLAILSNGSSLRQRGKIRAAGLAGFPDGIFISEEINAEKPAVRAFETVLEEFHLCPEETLMVGDDWNRDILGAYDLGIRAVDPKNTHSLPEGRWAGKIEEVSRLKELKSIL